LKLPPRPSRAPPPRSWRWATRCTSSTASTATAPAAKALQRLPALAGNRAVTLASHVNPVQAILSGGFAPATAGNPQPYGMPPYRTLLTDTEVAAVASFIRQSWGNQAGAVTALDVQRVR
jgi:hypothetical protein